MEKIKTDIEPAGVNHMILSLADPALVKLFSGEDVPNVPEHPGPAQARRRPRDAGVRVTAPTTLAFAPMRREVDAGEDRSQWLP